MNLFGVMEISGSAMRAERLRAEVAAANMANAETTRSADGSPYRPQHVVFEATPRPRGFAGSLQAAAFEEPAGEPDSLTPGSFGSSPLAPASLASFGVDPESAGVAVAAVFADPSPPLKRYDPGHPDADADGYVAYPDINPVTELVDLMGATRAYGLNNAAVQAEKSMILSALELAKT